MSSYSYSSLPEGSIRLIRLLPHQDKNSPIQCQLFDCPLFDSESTYPYEALSYVWGSEEKPQSISMDNHSFLVGQNLHAALLHLRSRFLERILWIDAVCIDQGNLAEKGLQVQSMAKIFAKASRVIVWLGEAAADSNQALEDIRVAAAKQSRTPSTDEANAWSRAYRGGRGLDQKAILTLLQRPWFERIWVLQEVAAARHILIKCGHTEIDGYAFCSGLSALKLSYETCPDRQALIYSATYLIRDAALRPRCATSHHLDRFSLNICTLGELVDMYHTRKATDPRDKVYALLAMSSDSPGLAGLSADYGILWRELFRRLVNFLISEQMSVHTRGDKEMAIIEGKGLILGKVLSAMRDTNWKDRQIVEIAWGDHLYCIDIEETRTSNWTFQAPAKSIQGGDVVCLLQGASRPTIIRLYKDHWIVIMAVVRPTDDLHGPTRDTKRAELLLSTTTFPYDFLLVWDWDMDPSKSQDGEDREYFVHSRPPECSKTELGDNLNKAIRLGKVGMVFQGVKGRKYLRKAMKIFEAASRDMDSRWRNVDAKLKGITDLLIEYKDAWAPLMAAEAWHEVVVKLLLDAINVALDIDRIMLLSWAAENGDEVLVKTPLSWAAEKGDEVLAKLLLDTYNIDLNVEYRLGKEALLIWAAHHGHGVVVKLLLDTGEINLDAKSRHRLTPLSLAAQNGHEAVVKLLLDTGKIDLNTEDVRGQTPLSLAAKNGHEAVVKLLLDTGKIDLDARTWGGQTLLSLAAENGHKAVVKQLVDTGKIDLDTLDRRMQTPLSLAAKNGHEAVVKLLLDTGKADLEAKNWHGQTPLSLAAENGHEAVVRLLLDTRKVDLNTMDKLGQTPLSLAAENGHEAVVELLQSRRQRLS